MTVRTSRRFALLAVALLATACGSTAPASVDPSGPMGAIAYVLDSTHCDPTQWIEGVIVPGDTGVAIRTDQGMIIPLLWAKDNTAVLEWGQRYRIGGDYPFDGSLWACAGASAVIPE